MLEALPQEQPRGSRTRPLRARAPHSPATPRPAGRSPGPTCPPSAVRPPSTSSRSQTGPASGAWGAGFPGDSGAPGGGLGGEGAGGTGLSAAAMLVRTWGARGPAAHPGAGPRPPHAGPCPMPQLQGRGNGLGGGAGGTRAGDHRGRGQRSELEWGSHWNPRGYSPTAAPGRRSGRNKPLRHPPRPCLGCRWAGVAGGERGAGEVARGTGWRRPRGSGGWGAQQEGKAIWSRSACRRRRQQGFRSALLSAAPRDGENSPASAAYLEHPPQRVGKGTPAGQRGPQGRRPGCPRGPSSQGPRAPEEGGQMGRAGPGPADRRPGGELARSSGSPAVRPHAAPGAPCSRGGTEDRGGDRSRRPPWDRAGSEGGRLGHLLLSFCGWFKNILVKIHPHQALPLLQLRQLEADDLVDAVVDGPVELLRLVAGQHQHEPAPADGGLRGWGAEASDPHGAALRQPLLGSSMRLRTASRRRPPQFCPCPDCSPLGQQPRPTGRWLSPLCTAGTGTPG